ncbi:MAG TPA: nuclear transport factor 2 family protein [Candidatus Limnocylindria bacterium]|nr:nuclear transport factor 2 family protein [Candidatus Limnocylindria bacterium]
MTRSDRPAPDETPIRDAERRLAAALQSPDPTAWVYEYTEDAVFDAGSEHAAQGREELLAMARSMRRLSEVSIRPLRTEVHGDLAAVWCEGSWISGIAPETRHVAVRGIIVWRREPDGVWRVALEHMA